MRPITSRAPVTAIALVAAQIGLPGDGRAADLPLPPPTRATDWYTGAEAAAIEDSWTVAIDGSTSITSNSSAFGSLTATIAAAGTLVQSGPRVRIEGVAGTYTYPSQGSSQGASRGARALVTGYQQEGSAMMGYEWVWRDAALAGYIGFNVRSNQLSIADPDNPVVGTGVGLKLAGNAYLTPTDRTMASAYASYSTKFNAYYSRFRVGYMVADGVYLGPEGLMLGDDFFRQYRIGAHLTGVSFGPVRMSVAAGYVKDRVQGSGYYTSVEARANF